MLYPRSTSSWAEPKISVTPSLAGRTTCDRTSHGGISSFARFVLRDHCFASRPLSDLLSTPVEIGLSPQSFRKNDRYSDFIKWLPKRPRVKQCVVSRIQLYDRDMDVQGLRITLLYVCLSISPRPLSHAQTVDSKPSLCWHAGSSNLYFFTVPWKLVSILWNLLLTIQELGFLVFDFVNFKEGRRSFPYESLGPWADSKYY